MNTCHQTNIQAAAWRQSLRQHVDIASLHPYASSEPHWLIEAALGRDLLIQKLRQVRPGIRFSAWANPSAIDPLLDAMIDELNVRWKQRPRTWRELFQYVHWIATQSHHIGASACMNRPHHAGRA